MALLVIGGSNVDYSAYSKRELILRDSNIGRIEISFGGVGRNIVENLALLGEKVTFLTALGQDEYGRKLKGELTSLNVDVRSPFFSGRTPAYCAIYDHNHDMFTAVCDTQILDSMRKEDLYQYDELINGFESIILDCNLNEEILDYLFSRYRDKRFYVEAVSANKAPRIFKHLESITLLKANLLEAKALLNSDFDAITLCEMLMNKGVKSAVITEGEKPITWFNDKTIQKSKVEPVENVISASGAGDSLFSGLIYALNRHCDFKKALDFAKEVSKITLLSNRACNPELKAELMKKGLI